MDLGDMDWGQIAGGFATPSLAGQPAPMMPPATPPMPIPPSPISPEFLAKNMAARGVPPPPVDMPPPGSVGEALTGTPLGGKGVDNGQAPGAPLDITPKGVDGAATADPTKKGGGLADALRGVKMPAGPELQRLGTPAAPRVTNSIKGGQLFALLQALNSAPGAESRKLPTTLPQAFGR